MKMIQVSLIMRENILWFFFNFIYFLVGDKTGYMVLISEVAIFEVESRLKEV